VNPVGEGLRAEKLAIVRALLDALDARDVVAIGRLLTDVVVYHFPGRGPLAGTYRGREAVLELFRTFARLFDEPLIMRRHDVVASEAHVVDLATYTGVRGDQRFEWSVARLYHVEADRISEIWLMIGDVYAFDAWLG
jgi:ketosteroid isomerase-like protein